MRLLLLNGNTSQAMTNRLMVAACSIADAGTEIVPLTARFGAEVIASRAAYAIASHAVLDAFAAYSGAQPDAVVLACFGDPGLAALREVSGLPCFGMAEAGCRAAAAQARRFSIVTGGKKWGPMLTEYAASLGLATQLASVRVLQADGGQIGAQPEAAREAIFQAAQAAVSEDGAELVILGGAGMVGQVEPLAARLNVPVIDGLTPAIRMAEAATGELVVEKPSPVASTGLSGELSRLLAR
ncbi:aspartate/glutamate racemase family protein [Ferrovibrio sp.]|uniref:aspartate/glutamate racemase family protein n=1 Tax=Ferrovibrio sp. TaxID=1917215 RepID=UPI001B7CC23C|nr:aspartate/glutamate racemase family protein [Ferrovibrio sp.]MBP7063852.1 aspartate/glutamate racemase family protein [Ferrovibrio sp.]